MQKAEEDVALDLGDEYETALNKATQEEIIDLAAILGFHSMMNQDQYHASLLNKGQPIGLGWDGITKASPVKAYPAEAPNQTDVDDHIKRIKDNDSKLTESNWNNIKVRSVFFYKPTLSLFMNHFHFVISFQNISDEKFEELFNGLKSNTNLQLLSLTNTGLQDKHALLLAEALEANSSLKVLNVETNFITPPVVVRLVKALLGTMSLEELRASNQVGGFFKYLVLSCL